MSESAATRCVACGATVSARYCGECGELAVRHDYSLKHFAEEIVETFTHVDGRIFGTFRSLVLRPGLLARDFLAGRRKRQFGPVRVFVICNIIYFLVQPFTLFAPFTSTLQIQTTARAWRGIARELVDAKLAARGQTFAQYATVYDKTAHVQGKSLVILMVPVFALGAWVLHRRARRFYAEHIVASFYTYAFLLLWFAVGTLVLSEVFRAVLRLGFGATGEWLEIVSTPIVAIPIAGYLLLSERTIYGESWPVSVIKAAMLTGWVIAVLTAYRLVLFFTAFYAT